MERLDKRNIRIPFAVTFCTANRVAWKQRKSMLAQLDQLKSDSQEWTELKEQIEKLDIGGDIITLDRVTLSGKPQLEIEKRKLEEKKALGKNPHHFTNKTRNFRIVANGDVRKAHLRLILQLNGTDVLY